MVVYSTLTWFQYKLLQWKCFAMLQNPGVDIWHIRVSQELRSLLRDLIPELYSKSETSYTHGSNWQQFRSYEFLNTVNKLESKEEHCAFIELCC